MRARTLAIAFAASVGLPFLVLVACSGNPEGSQSPSTSESGASTPGATTGAGTAPVANGVPPMSACKDMTADITNDLPDGGLVMNNAAPVGDAGPSDRITPVEKAILDNRNRFRCCFDAGGKRPPNQEFKMTMVLDLKPSGEVREASFDRAETDATSDEIEACMIGIAKSISYNESGVGKDTTFRHRFKFKTHY
jgi:hypothetical protein